MTDIHSHVLPFVDDGSDSFDNSFALLENIVSQGVDKVILTPHFKRGTYNLSADVLKEKFSEFSKAVSERNIPVKLYLGQEILCDGNVYDLIKEGKVLTMNGTKYVFLEFNYFGYTDIVDYAYNVLAMGYIPVIAHIERYVYLSLKSLVELKKIGALIQVNASSITGESGRAFRKKTLATIKSGLVDFVATDAHFGRTSNLLKAYKIIKRKFGETVANDLFNENAKVFNLE